MHCMMQVKQQDNKDIDLKGWCTQLVGTARAMGLRVVPRPEDGDIGDASSSEDA